MLVDILSLFPNYFRSPFDEGVIKRAINKGLVEIDLHNIRDFAEGKYRRVDDRPYGGGPGMVMMAHPVVQSIRKVKTRNSHVVYLSPQGKPLKAKRCQELANYEHLLLLCGHYEGIDQRALDMEVDEEISIGDYVLSNGCLPAIVLLDAVLRFVPGVLGHEDSVKEDSFQEGLLDWPHYTRPPFYEGRSVPEVLQRGNHGEIRQWRYAQARKKTSLVRNDLFSSDDCDEGK